MEFTSLSEVILTKYPTSIVISCSQVTKLICIFEDDSNNSTSLFNRNYN